jgi:hypothetical protein
MIEDKDLYIQKLEKKIKKLKKKNKELIKSNNYLSSKVNVEEVIEDIKNNVDKIQKEREELLKSREDLKEEFNNKFLLKIKQFKEQNQEEYINVEELSEDQKLMFNFANLKLQNTAIYDLIQQDLNSEGEENGNQ